MRNGLLNSAVLQTYSDKLNKTMQGANKNSTNESSHSEENLNYGKLVPHACIRSGGETWISVSSNVK